MRKTGQGVTVHLNQHVCGQMHISKTHLTQTPDNFREFLILKYFRISILMFLSAVDHGRRALKSGNPMFALGSGRRGGQDSDIGVNLCICRQESAGGERQLKLGAI